MVVIPIILAAIGSSILSLIVFGGGQVFIPLYTWMWQLLSDQFGLNLHQDIYDQVIAVVNLTPGLVSTKLAAISGILIANQAWWGFLALVLIYAFFILPAIFVMQLANKFFVKLKKGNFIHYLGWFKPVIAGIILALAIQLLIGVLVPNWGFNIASDQYLKPLHDSNKSQFFAGWRLIMLRVFVPVILAFCLYAYYRKCHLFLIFVGAIVVCMLVFSPWRN